jgi:excisionase family DNA binding protein
MMADKVSSPILLMYDIAVSLLVFYLYSSYYQYVMKQVTLPDILTLEEASQYLRLPVETVMRQASQGNLPGRKIENEWRFLKLAIDDWLRSNSSRSVLIQQTGALADDDSLAELRTSIYQARGRSEVDDNSV